MPTSTTRGKYSRNAASYQNDLTDNERQVTLPSLSVPQG